METYYRCTIARLKPRNTNFTVTLEHCHGSGDWTQCVVKPACSAGHGQEIAEQMRLARNATNYAFAVVVDTRG